MRRTDALDVLGVLAVPVALSVAETLVPGAATEVAYQFDYSDPSVVSAWTSNYLHLTPRHRTGNQLFSLVVALPALALALARDGRRRFWLAFGLILSVGPFVVTGGSYLLVQYVFPGEPTRAGSAGFSGLLYAVTGVLAVLVWRASVAYYGRQGRWFRRGVAVVLVGELLVAFAGQLPAPAPVRFPLAVVGAGALFVGGVTAVAAPFVGRPERAVAVVAGLRERPGRHVLVAVAVVALAVTVPGIPRLTAQWLRGRLVLTAVGPTYVHTLGALFGVSLLPLIERLTDR
ncbi:MAG: hypothetical protein ABEI75_03485 [Halobaculum sp.]